LSTMAPERKTMPKALPATLQQPLARLQSAIRRYIVLESISLVVIACVVWALVGLLIDWGFLFKLLGFDYIREGSPSIQTFLRSGALLILVAGVGYLLYRFLFSRLMRPITTSDLAMLLERRFSKELGDKFVTAVELHDWEKAREQGYSPSMLETTTRDAELGIRSIDTDATLNKPRLRQLLGIASGCIILTLAGLLFLPEVVATFLERGVLWRNVTWPRSTVMELADFSDRNKAVPFGSELKVVVRSAKWALADRTVSEGWRPLVPADLAAGTTAWELEGLNSKPDFLSVLPAGWQKLSFDQLESQLSEVLPKLQRELGLSLIQKLQDHLWENRQQNAPLPESLQKFLPEKLKGLNPEEQKTALAAAASLTSADAQRILEGLTTLRPITGDFSLSMVRLSSFSLPSPLPPLTVLQKIAYERDRDLPAFAMLEAERQLLPASWQKLAIRDLAKRLKNYASEESAESLGQRVIEQSKVFFADLETRANQTRFASRKSFRQLVVPEKLTLEFENLESDERNRSRAKRGQPELKRQSTSNDFQYDFKKVERPMRLRASITSIATPWYKVDVKPLPTLKKLVRYHSEPGYLYGSIGKVEVGPLVMPLDGEESRATAPLGSTVRFEGESHKPLKMVRVTTENPADAPIVNFKAGDTAFTIIPKTTSKDDLRMKLEYEDDDGITATRTLLLILTPDKPPEFVKAQFEAINRKFITSKALLPLSVAVRDDVGMLGLEYEVSLQKNDRTPVYEVRVPFRSYSAWKYFPTQPGGMRFENVEDLTLPRVFAQLYSDSTADPFQIVSTLARLPSGWLASMPALPFGLRREYSLDYVDRNLSGPVLSQGDEFLDTLLLRTALNKPVNDPLVETPYRMVVRLVARDNRMNNGVMAHQEGKSAESFEFNVVSEQDLLIEGGKREEDLRDRFDETINQLRKARSSLKRIRDELGTPGQAKDDDVRRAMNDAQDNTKALAAVRAALDEKVLREFRQIYREFALNRVDERVLDRIDRRICNPLAILLQPEQTYAKLEQSVDTLARRLETEGASLPPTLLEQPVIQADRVLQKLEEILNDMRKLIEFNEALRVLRDLINNEQKLVEEMKKLIEKKLKNDLDDK
jgi:hypothetical protein